MARYYKDILDKFYKRCKNNPNYSVAIAINDANTFFKVVEEAKEMFDGDDSVSDVYYSGVQKFGIVWFKNDAKCVFGRVEDFDKDVQYNAWMFDKSIRQEELDRHVGRGIEYEVEGVDCTMMNFDPIPIKFTEPQFIDCLDE